MSVRSKPAHPVCSSKPSRHVWKTVQPCESVSGLQFPVMLNPGQKSYLDFSVGGTDSASITFALLILACNVREISPVRKHTLFSWRFERWHHLKLLLPCVEQWLHQLHRKVFLIAKPMSKKLQATAGIQMKTFSWWRTPEFTPYFNNSCVVADWGSPVKAGISLAAGWHLSWTVRVKCCPYVSSQ